MSATTIDTKQSIRAVEDGAQGTNIYTVSEVTS